MSLDYQRSDDGLHPSNNSRGSARAPRNGSQTYANDPDRMRGTDAPRDVEE